MIINDKALVKLMNHAKKNGGYRYAMTDGDPAWYYITAPGWYVGIQADKLSGKVLGTLTEHLKRNPRPGDACLILKKTVKDEYYEVITEPIFTMNAAGKASQRDNEMRIRPTPMMWRDDQVCQRGDGEILLMDPAVMELVVQFTWSPVQCHEYGPAFFDAGEEQVYIFPEVPLAGDEEFIKKIAALEWAPKEE